MAKFKLDRAISGEIVDPDIVLGRIEFDFPANRTTPQSEQDLVVFRYLTTLPLPMLDKDGLPKRDKDGNLMMVMAAEEVSDEPEETKAVGKGA